MHRLVLNLVAAACLCLMTYGSSWAAATVSVWVALSEVGGAHTEAAQALRAELERSPVPRIEWQVAHWSHFASSKPEPHLVVAIGATALRAMQELFADDATPPPLLSLLVPRFAFERIADSGRLRAGTLSAVFLDQPPARQLDLIRLALPEVRNLGMLVGAESRAHVGAFEKAAKERGISVVVAQAETERLFATLQAMLPEVDGLLAVPDPAIFNSQTAANILMAAYRRQLPLIGFSPAYVKAGALLAVYSTPLQMGTRGGEMLRQALAGRTLPPPQWPVDFVVSVNQDVARSLGFVLHGPQLGEQLRLKERP
jgi:hypothetical protein